MRFLVPTLIILLTAGCGGDPGAQTDAGESDDHAHGEHDHGHGEHGDHAHHKGSETGHDDHAHAGQAHELASVAIGEASYALTLFGAVEAGGELSVNAQRSGGNAPSAVRAWVGVADGRGSMKARLDAETERRFHGHLAVPAELDEDAALWIEVQDADGQRSSASVALPDVHEH